MTAWRLSWPVEAVGHRLGGTRGIATPGWESSGVLYCAVQTDRPQRRVFDGCFGMSFDGQRMRHVMAGF